MPLPPPDPSRRARLNALKLGALVRDHTGDPTGRSDEFGAGAALVRPDEAGVDEAWVLVEEAENPVGVAVAWATRRDIARLHLVIDDGGLAAVVARRAALSTLPTTVWRVDGRALVGVAVEPLAASAGLDPRRAVFADLIAEAGAEPVVEHGVLTGEVAGLEVCRAVIDTALDEARLEVGVGAHDREAFQLIHGNRPTLDALRDVVAYVAEHRRPGARPHALNRLAAERALRSRLLAEPALIGARALHTIVPPVARRNVKDPAPCFAAGVDGDGRELVVAVAVGGVLDLPFAGAEARLLHAPEARLVLAVPRRDATPVLARLAALVRGGAEVRPVPPPG